MESEYETFNQQNKEKIKRGHHGNQFQKDESDFTGYNSIINSVGPDLSIPGQEIEGKTIGYQYHQQQSLYGHNEPSIQTENNKGVVPWPENHQQMSGDVYQHHGSHYQSVISRCCCPYVHCGYYPYGYKY